MGSGALANSTGSFNTALGSGAGFNATSGDGNVYIGLLGSPSPESNHSYIRNINTTSVSGGGTDTVTVNFNFRYYGRPVRADSILSGVTKPPPGAAPLRRALGP